MRSRKREGTRNTQEPIGPQSVLIMGNGAADREQQHASGSCRDHTHAVMALKSDAESKNAQRQDNDEHLRVQMPLIKSCKKWHPCNNER